MLALVLTLLAQGADTRAGSPGDPVRAVLEAFDRHPLVALSEPHDNQQFHAFLGELLRDPGFLERVDVVAVEFATAFRQDVLDRFIAGHDVTEDELTSIWRDVIVSPQSTWDAPVYRRFFETVRGVNLAARAAGKQRRLRVLAGDPPADWAKIHERAQLMALYRDPRLERDFHFSSVIEREVLAKDKRALLVAGGGHLTRRNLWVPPAPNPSPDTTTVQLLRRHPQALYMIFTLGPRILDEADLLQKLRGLDAPTVIPLATGWMGEWSASDFLGVRRYNVEGPGKWPFEGLAFREIADAALYLGTTFSDSLPPFDYQEDAYRRELNRRRSILSAPERTRTEQGLVEASWLIDAGRLEEAASAIEEIATWEPHTAEELASIDDLLARMDSGR